MKNRTNKLIKIIYLIPLIAFILHYTASTAYSADVTAGTACSVVKSYTCKGHSIAHSWETPSKCSTCGGDHKVTGTCGTCSGNKTVKCTTCSGRGYTNTYIGSIADGGYIYKQAGCTKCGGSAYAEVYYDKSGTEIYWDGFGYKGGTGKVTCGTCSGNGTTANSANCTKCYASGTNLGKNTRCTKSGCTYNYYGPHTMSGTCYTLDHGTTTTKCDNCTTTYYTHESNGTYSSNDTQHWFTCKHCGNTMSTANHSFGANYDDAGTTKKKCGTCGKVVTVGYTSYTVNYNGNGATSGSMEGSTATYNSNFKTKQNAFSKTGYTFNGWNEKSDGTGTAWTLTSAGVYEANKSWKWTYTNGITLYAQWTAIDYTVTYNANGGTCNTSSKDYIYEDTVDLSVTASKDGKTFIGWHTDKNSRIPLTSYSMPANDVTLYAVYTSPASDVANHKYPDYEKVKTDEVYLLVWDTTNTSNQKKYQLTYDDSVDAGAMVYNYKLNADVSAFTKTLSSWGYAVYAVDNAGNTSCLYKGSGTTAPPVINKYMQYVEHIKFNEATGQYETVSFDTTSLEVIEGNSYTPSAITAPSGYYAHSIKTDSGEVVLENGATSSSALEYTVSKSQTSYVYYKPLDYTVTFDANGGECDIANKTVTYSGKYGTLPTAYKYGHTFVGWYTEASGGTKVTADTIVTTAKNHTLHAHYTANTQMTVTFNVNDEGDGTGNVNPTSKTVINKEAYGELPVPTRKGYTFLGWYTAASGGALVESDDIVTKTANHTIYAHWEAHTYTVKLKGNSAQSGSVADIKCTYGKTYTAPANGFVKDKASFLYWTFMGENGSENKNAGATFSNLTSVDGGVVYAYAQWETLSAKIKFYKNAFPSDTEFIELPYYYERPNSMLPEMNSLWENYGYSLIGWVKSNTATNAFYNITTPIDDAYIDANYPVADYDLIHLVDDNFIDQYYPSGKLYGLWKPNKYTYNIVYKSETGKILGKATETHYFTTTNEIKPKSFNGYTSPASQTVKWDSTDPKTITFTYKLITYNITYKLEDENRDSKATNPSGQVKTYNVETPTFSLLEPTSKGYTFLGWFNNSSKTGSAITQVAQGSYGNKTFYAKWRQNDYTIVFDPNKIATTPNNIYNNAFTTDVTGSISNIDTRYDDTVTLPSKGYNRVGYTLKGWSRAANSKTVEYTGGQVVNKLNLTDLDKGSVTLYAIWEPITYTISYDRGNTNSTAALPQNVTLRFDQSGTLSGIGSIKGTYYKFAFNTNKPDNATSTPVSIATRTGYLSFKDWSLSNTDSTTAYRSGSTVKNLRTTPGTVTVTATWNNEIITNYADTSLTGWKFLGWFTDATAGSKTESITLKPSKTAHDITLYAHWSANTYTIVYNSNDTVYNIYNDISTTSPGGSVSNTNATYDSPTKLATNKFTKVGYKFKGWSLNKDWKVGNSTSQIFADAGTLNHEQFTGSSYAGGFTATQGDTITLYAIWEPVRYNVALNSHDDNTLVDWNDTDVILIADIRYDQDIWLVDLPFKRQATTSNPVLVNDGTGTYIKAGYSFLGYTRTKDSTQFATVEQLTGATKSDLNKSFTLNRNIYDSNGKTDTANKNLSMRNLTVTNGVTVNLYAVWGKTVKVKFDLNEDIGKNATTTYSGSTLDSIELVGTMYNNQYYYPFDLLGEQTQASAHKFNAQTGTIKAFGTVINNGMNSVFKKSDSDKMNYRFIGWSTTDFKNTEVHKPITQLDPYNTGSGKGVFNSYDTITLYACWEPELKANASIENVISGNKGDYNETDALTAYDVINSSSNKKSVLVLFTKPGEQAQYLIESLGRTANYGGANKIAKIEFDSSILKIYEENGIWTDTLNPISDRYELISSDQKQSLNRIINPLGYSASRKFIVPMYLGTKESHPDSRDKLTYANTITVEQYSYYYDNYTSLGNEKVVIPFSIVLADTDETEVQSIIKDLKARLKLKLNL